MTDSEIHFGNAGHPKAPTTRSSPSTGPPCTGNSKMNTNNAARASRGQPEQVEAVVGPQEPHADPQETGQQDEVREEGEIDVVGAGPPDQPELHEQHEEAQHDQADLGGPGDRALDIG